MSERSSDDAIGAAATVVADSMTGGETAMPVARTVLAGRYEIEALLGSGGMGAVYRARDRELDELVALKMLSRALVDAPGVLARFRQEVKLARRVTHRNVARMFDIGDHAGEKFLTMELVDGESLAALAAREHPLKLQRIVAIVTDVCAGLGAAHAAGVVHRDLKPDNVLVAKDGRVVITDFGIARVSSPDAIKTMGLPIGTPAYMAPEQVDGAEDVDGRADIYALGAMLFELLTAERAWLGDSIYQVAALRLIHPPPNPRDRRADIPDAVAQIVMTCMARNREDRYPAAEDVANAISSVTLPVAVSIPAAPMSAAASARRALGVRPTTAPDAKTIAVLPLRNAGQIEDEYLADGLTEDLIDTLSMGKGLRVRSRGAVARYKSGDRDPRDVGRELDVHVVVDGSVRRVGDDLRVNVHLVSAGDGFQIWAKRFDGSIADLFKIGDDAAHAICQALALQWNAPMRDVSLDPIAMDLYLRGRHEYHQMWRDANDRAIDYFEQALARAPSSADVLNGLANALCRRFAFDDASDETIDRALYLAQRSLEVAPDRGEAHVAIASVWINIGKAAQGARELLRALELAPDSPDGNETCGRVLCEVGRTDEGIARLSRAMSLEPGFEGTRYEIGRIRALEGDWAASDAIFAAPPQGFLANPYWISRWRVLLWKGDRELASRLIDEVMNAPDFGVKHGAIGMLLVCAHRMVPPEAIIELDVRATAGRALRRRAFFKQMKSEILAYSGELDASIAALTDAEEAGLFDIFWLDRCPLFDTMRDDARFVAVRTRVAARAADVLRALTSATAKTVGA